MSPALTDSPWFWLLLFSTFGLAAMLTLGPKYSLRQGGIEARFDNRETALAWEGQEINSLEAVERTRLPRSPGDRPLTISLQPLLMGVGVLIALAIMGLSLVQLSRGRRKLPAVRSQQSILDPVDPDGSS